MEVRRPTAVVFDFFGTLVEVDDDRPTMAEVLTDLGFECPPALERVWNSLGFDGEETPSTSSIPAYDQWRQSNLLTLLRVVGVPEDRLEEVLRAVVENDRSWTVRAVPGAQEILSILDERGVPYCICSNWDYGLTRYLDQAELPSVRGVTSAEVGARKPSSRVVSAALDLLGVEPMRSIWFVGDSWEADVVAALRTGLQPILIAGNNPAPRHVPSVESLVNLCEVMRRDADRSAK